MTNRWEYAAEKHGIYPYLISSLFAVLFIYIVRLAPLFAKQHVRPKPSNCYRYYRKNILHWSNSCIWKTNCEQCTQNARTLDDIIEFMHSFPQHHFRDNNRTTTKCWQWASRIRTTKHRTSFCHRHVGNKQQVWKNFVNGKLQWIDVVFFRWEI